MTRNYVLFCNLNNNLVILVLTILEWIFIYGNNKYNQDSQGAL